MDEAGYELSASYMNGLVKSVREAGMLEAILVGLPADLRAAFMRPALQAWWDASFGEQLVLAVYDQFGAPAVEQIGYGVVAESIGPLVMPQVRALLAAGGGGPQTLFSQLDQFIATAVRPVKAKWTPLGEKSGRIELQYPRPIRTGIPALWLGAIRYVFELTRAEGKIDRAQHDEPGGKLLFEVSWA